MHIITICCSASFYRQAVDIQEELEAQGFAVLLPESALKMKASGDFDVTHSKTWFNDANDYHKKTDLIRKHFDKVAEGDAILVLNYEKNGKSNYIGGNVLMEMAIAFHLKKPIFVLNDAPEDSPFLEEILGLQSILLHGDITSLPAELATLRSSQ